MRGRRRKKWSIICGVNFDLDFVRELERERRVRVWG